MVYRFREARVDPDVLVGAPMVAKETRFELSEHDKVAFHSSFAETQCKAREFALRFNDAVSRAAPLTGLGEAVAKIDFLPCCVYTWYEKDVQRGVLVEKRLDPSQYTKWNGNNGYVKGAARVKPSDSSELAALVAAAAQLESKATGAGTGTVAGVGGVGERTVLPVLRESDEEDAESGFDDVSDSEASGAGSGGDGDDVVTGAHGTRAPPVHAPTAVRPEQFIHAFSHFTHYASKRKMLVCDLQGELDKTATPATFWLTDPVIHYKSQSGRKHVYGRTDRGATGVSEFFSSHVCNDVCRALRLPGSRGPVQSRQRTTPS
jgi:hypothetical protein